MFDDLKQPQTRKSIRPLPDLFDWAEPDLMTQAPPHAEAVAVLALPADATGGDGDND